MFSFSSKTTKSLICLGVVILIALCFQHNIVSANSHSNKCDETLFQYRLGDIVKGKWRGVDENGTVCFPNTIGQAYVDQTSNLLDLDVLCSIARSKQKLWKIRVPNDTVVVHIRTGDVVKSETHASDMWKHGDSGQSNCNPQNLNLNETENCSFDNRRYLFSWKYYNATIDLIPTNITKIMVRYSTIHERSNKTAEPRYIESTNCDIFLCMSLYVFVPICMYLCM